MLAFALHLLASQPKFTSATTVNQDGASYVAYDPVTKIVSVVETSTGSVKSQLKGLTFGPYYTKFSPNGRILAGSNMAGEVGLWEVPTGKLIFNLVDADQGHLSGVVYPLAFSSDGRLLAVGNMMREKRSRSGPTSGILSIWDTKSGSQVQEIRTDPYESVANLVFREHNSVIRMAGLTVTDFDVRTRNKHAQLLPYMSLRKMSDDGEWAFGGGLGWMDLWDIAKRKRTLHLLETEPEGVFASVDEAISPGGKWIIVTRSHLVRSPGGDTGYTAVQLDLLESKTGKSLWTVSESVGARFLSFSPDGETVHLSNGEIRHCQTGTIVRKLGLMEIVLLGAHAVTTIAHPISSDLSKVGADK